MNHNKQREILEAVKNKMNDQQIKAGWGGGGRFDFSGNLFDITTGLCVVMYNAINPGEHEAVEAAVKAYKPTIEKAKETPSCQLTSPLTSPQFSPTNPFHPDFGK